MIIISRIVTIFLAAAGIACATASIENRSNTFNWSGQLSRGQFVEIKAVNGNIRAESTDGSEVEVIAEKYGRRFDPSDVEIAVLDNGDGITVCAVYPRRHGHSGDCKPGKSGLSYIGANDVKVDFTVRIPSGVRFIGRTVTGGVQAVDLDSDVEAHTVNGKIDVSTSGTALADSVNGSIHALLRSTRWDGARSFSTINGSIQVELPGDINADLAASTVNGHITSLLPIIVRGHFMTHCVHGTLGSGGRELKISTVNGSITVAQVS